MKYCMFFDDDEILRKWHKQLHDFVLHRWLFNAELDITWKTSTKKVNRCTRTDFYSHLLTRYRQDMEQFLAILQWMNLGSVTMMERPKFWLGKRFLQDDVVCCESQICLGHSFSLRDLNRTDDGDTVIINQSSYIYLIIIKKES